MRLPKRPLLPGNSIDLNVGQTRFHKSHQLDFVVKGVPYINEKTLPGIGGIALAGSRSERKPSVYALGEVVKLPAWLVFDKHVLAFDSYYLEKLDGTATYNFIVHRCKIYFFLEDGTIKVIEQRNPLHDGLSSGCIIHRQRIRYPAEGSEDFYDILDLNIGNDVEFFGKLFRLIDCDEFTRKFLNRLGIFVPDKIALPEDPFSKLVKEKKKKTTKPPRLNKKITLDEFLCDANRKLTFYAYWDDRGNENGIVHLLLVIYYVVDETIEIKDITEKDKVINILKRGKLRKDVHYTCEGPGSTEPFTVLNALGKENQPLRYILDALDIGGDHRPIYSDSDLRVGVVISALGRKIVIYDCDEFTREYYKAKFGIERQDPIERPETRDEELAKLQKKIEFRIPPYNGFGSYEDSLSSCFQIRPQGIVKPYKKFLERDRLGFDCNILRFLLRMLVKNQPIDRTFILSYYLSDDTISVYEIEQPNSGSKGGMFICRRQVFKPGQKVVTTRPPEAYSYNDLYIENTICLDEFWFDIVGSDEYTIRYMETHPNEFPKSNIQIILKKVKENVTPVFKSFVASFLSDDGIPPAAYPKFRDTIKTVMKDKITEHEIITLARFYAHEVPQEPVTLELLRRYTHDELRKKMYSDLARLRECFLHYDPKKCGFVSKEDAYKALRGCRVPLETDLIRVLLEKLGKGEHCHIVYDELINFLNYQCEPSAKHIVPINISATMAWLKLCRPQEKSINCINVDKLIKDFDLEKELANQCK